MAIFPSLRSLGSKSKSDQNKINWLAAAAALSPTPSLISFHLAALSFRLLQTDLTPTGIPYLHIFIYLLPHSLFYLIHSPLSPLPPTALSANNLKLVCHCRDTEWHCLSYYPNPPHLPNVACFITSLIGSDQNPIESRSNICISPSSVWFNCQCCQSCLRCYLPEPCHSSLPRNLVSRFTV